MILKDAPEGFQPTEIGLIPVDWKLKQAKDISGCIVPGRNKPKKFDGIIPWVTTSDIDKLGKIDNSKISLFISKEEANAIGSRVVPANAVIMSCVGELGVVCVAENEIVINQQLHAFLPNSKINSKYLSYILSSLKEYFYSKATKTTLPYLNKDNCNSTPIPLPCIEEQTAIANALSDIDALLTELEKLIDKKQAIKTATMQQLLTGKTRLPQFATYTKGTVEGKRKGTKPSKLGEIPEDWDAIRMGDLAKVQRGASPRPIDSPIWFDRNSEIGWLRISDVTKTSKYLFETTQSLSRLGVENSRYVASGNLVMSICATVGKPIITRKHLCIHDGFVVFNNLQVEPSYMYYILKDLEDEWGKQGQTGSQMNLNTDLINSTFISVPQNKEEQTAIANILSDMDNEIQTLEQRLAKTRQIKHGMMQELLTGCTRLPY